MICSWMQARFTAYCVWIIRKEPLKAHLICLIDRFNRSWHIQWVQPNKQVLFVYSLERRKKNHTINITDNKQLDKSWKRTLLSCAIIMKMILILFSPHVFFSWLFLPLLVFLLLFFFFYHLTKYIIHIMKSPRLSSNAIILSSNVTIWNRGKSYFKAITFWKRTQQ